jgi:hypothetical protein
LLFNLWGISLFHSRFSALVIMGSVSSLVPNCISLLNRLEVGAICRESETSDEISGHFATVELRPVLSRMQLPLD